MTVVPLFNRNELATDGGVLATICVDPNNPGAVSNWRLDSSASIEFIRRDSSCSMPSLVDLRFGICFREGRPGRIGIVDSSRYCLEKSTQLES